MVVGVFRVPIAVSEVRKFIEGAFRFVWRSPRPAHEVGVVRMRDGVLEPEGPVEAVRRPGVDELHGDRRQGRLLGGRVGTA